LPKNLVNSEKSFRFVEKLIKMSKYLDELRKIDRDVYNNMGKASQKIIDIAEELSSQFDRVIKSWNNYANQVGVSTDLQQRIHQHLNVLNKD